MDSFVYFAQRKDTGEIKIGVSGNVRERLYSFGKVKLLTQAPGTILDEARMHQRFIHSRTTGEWFLPTQDLIDTIEQVRRTGELPAHPTQTVHTGFQRVGESIIPVFTVVGPQPIGIAA